MKSGSLLCIGAVAGVLVASAAVEQTRFQAQSQTLMTVTDPAKAVMLPAPIRPEWVLEGEPKTLAAEIAHTDDATTKVYIWSTTKSRFRWLYDSDEVVTVIDGEVFVTNDGGVETHLGPGDVAFFPAGAKTTWRVPDHLRKIATLKRPLPGPVASVMRWMKAVKHAVRPTTAAFAG
jgi:uncharacterized cupin superfamily protein